MTQPFVGERGGDAHDAELLALLKGISASSGASDRFAGGEDDSGEEPPAPASAPEPMPAAPEPKPPARTSRRGVSSRDPNTLPPWKRGRAKPRNVQPFGENDDADIVVASPPPKRASPAKAAAPTELPSEVPSESPRSALPPSTGIGSGTRSTFTGERGGDAHDEELLALLRGVSANSGAADRFSGGEEENDVNVNGNDNGDNSVLENSNEILPDKREIRRPTSQLPTVTTKSPSPRKRNNNEIPPWKRGKAAPSPNTESPFGSASNRDTIVVAAKPKPSPAKAVLPKEPYSVGTEPSEPPTPAPPTTLGGGGNFSQPKSNFSGERGGDAHDEELLALLRGVSAKSSGADRFSGGDDHDETNVAEPLPQASEAAPTFELVEEKKEKDSPKTTGVHKGNCGGDLPPWKRGKNARQSRSATTEDDGVIDVVVAAPKPPPATKEQAAPPVAPEAVLGGGGNFQQPKSNFSGDRGGDAHDEELLALLRGISAKSGGADRFAGGDDDDINPNTNGSAQLPPQEEPLAADPVSPEPVPAEDVRPKTSSGAAPSRRSSRDANELPPWKRGKGAKTKPRTENLPPWKRGKGTPTKVDTEDVVVDIAVKVKPKPEPFSLETEEEQTPAPLTQEQLVGGGGNFPQTSNFQGDRGGDAHDEELLALLRGVSAKSGSADRFAGEDDNNEEQPVPDSQRQTQQPSKPPMSPTAPQPAVPLTSSASTSCQKKKKGWKKLGLTPPWKKNKSKKKQPQQEEDILVVEVPKGQPEKSAPLSPVSTAPPLPEHKEEEEASAPIEEGRGNFESLPSTFQGERGGDAHDEELLALLRGVSSSRASDRFAETDGAVPVEPEAMQSGAPDVAVVSPTDTPTKESPVPAGQGDFKQKSTFQGERGGDAHDEELLALLRGASSSRASDRFAETQESGPEKPETGQSETPVPVATKESPVPAGQGDFKQKSTFQGERGGDAHDEELLALLRGASSSRASDRFAETQESGPEKTETGQSESSLPVATEETLIPAGQGDFKQKSTFQGDRGGDAHDEELLALLRGASSSRASDRFAETEDAVAAPTPASPMASKPTAVPGGRGNFKQESTFQGDRGGDAHDEELLALLRGVSSNTGKTSDRFAETLDAELQPPEPKQVPAHKPPTTPQPSQSFPSSPTSMLSPFPTGEGEPEIVVTLDDLPSAFSDTNAKVRKESYRVLMNAILEASKGKTPGSIIGDSIVPGLDDLMPTLFAEKNAFALEVALQAGTEYANACQGASSEDMAAAIANSLLKGNGLSSPRPNSAKFATAFVLKLMEVGSTPESLKTIASILVQKGWVSKKPKVVQLSASLILDATHSFGAVNLPLAAIVSTLPKILSHSNKKIRDTGIEIVAEFCRSFGSKDPLESIIEKMQKSRVKELDALLSKRADPILPKTGLRCQSTSAAGTGASCAEDVFAALKAGSEEQRKQEFANRPAVKLMVEISKTNYSSQLQEAKWSKKVAALDMVMKCGGKEPYKLAQPSSSNNYVPLIIDMKGLLTHTHFAVVSKAMGVLGMLAQGVGEKLYPNLRPLLPKLLQLTKDKKLTKAVSACLDAFFGNVLGYEHLLDDKDSSIPEATNERKEKNALARTSALDYLDRCVSRGALAGPRASLSPGNANACAKLASHKLDDSDANVRKSALKILTSLQKVDDDEVQTAMHRIVDNLQKSNPRAYKTLSKNGSKAPAKSAIPKATSAVAKKAPKTAAQAPSTPRDTKTPLIQTHATAAPKTSAPRAMNTTTTQGNVSAAAGSNDEDMSSYEEAMTRCKSLGIPLWDEPDENEGGVLVGMQSSKWQSRNNSIQEIMGFVKTCPPHEDHAKVQNDSNALLFVVKSHTKNFKESNIVLARSILELFSALCEYHERSRCQFARSSVIDATALAVGKIADRKLSVFSKTLLSALCVVHPPEDVLVSACDNIEKQRSPLAHEEFLVWMTDFCNDFGATSIASSLKEIVAFCLSECKSKNIKVKRAAFTVMKTLHVQLGPILKAVTLASIKDASLREEFEKIFSENPFDSSLSTKEWPRSYILSSAGEDNHGEQCITGPGMQFEIPKMDLISELPSDCLSRMGSNEGNTAWKARKAALEDVEKALKGSSGLLDTSKMRPLADLLRAMRDRLSDSQSNLKPIAAKLIGLVLGSIDGEAQGKLGRIVYGPILNAAMNDKRKVMNDAAMEALRRSTSIPELNGEGLNQRSLEPFVVALTAELDGSEYKSAGIAGILAMTEPFAPHLPDLEKISSQRGETVGSRFASVLVNGLSSSKADIRSAAESLLSECITNNVFSMQTAKKCVSRMIPAKQRSVGMVLARISSSFTSGQVLQPTVEPSPTKPSRATKMRPSLGERAYSKSMHKSAIHESKPAFQPSTTRKSMLPAVAQQTFDDEEEAFHNEGSSHPLVHDTSTTGIQKSRAAMRSLTWPEYPEEPSGSGLYSGLKKAWAPIIPPDSIKKLFPDRGIRNQSDVMEAFGLLRQAIDMDKQEQGSVVVEQLHFILRWSVFVMGCKESAVGLTGLLDMLSELISYLSGILYEFSDSEVALFVTFLFERASVAKGRFKDTYMDLISSIKSDALILDKRLGPNVCVPLMESSSQAKARLLACQNCYQCVEAIGLSGIGKRGVLVAAKALSTDKLPENRAALLDLMVLLVSRMHNDVQRLSKICGSSLSHHARGLIEEQMKKAPSPGKIPSTKIPSPQKASRLPRPGLSSPTSKMNLSTSVRKIETDYNFSTPAVFEDELPALDLRRALREKESPRSTPTKLPQMSFSSSAQGLPLRSSYKDNSSAAVKADLFNSNLGSASEESDLLSSSTLGSSGNQKSVPSPVGAAASLRARLLKIRESNRQITVKPSETITIPMTDAVAKVNTQHSGDFHPHTSQIAGDSFMSFDQDNGPILETMLEKVRSLLEKPCPIDEMDEDLIYCTDILKNIHAAVSKQANLAVMISMNGVANLREEIREKASEVVGILTQLIPFGFHCHSRNVSAGMSVPLLSVNLAGLMAIFRSGDLATLVNVDDLTMLIKESGTALLDPRLAQSSRSGEKPTPQIDDATSTQMVRAINKLAVQAATGTARANSFQALILLQDQLSSNTNPSMDFQFKNRLSRVVTKLTTRVIKAEDSSLQPFSASSMDVEAVLCCLEDTLGAWRKADYPEGVTSTKNVAKLIVLAVLKARGETKSLQEELSGLEIDPHSSAVGELVASCALELGMAPSSPPRKSTQKDDVASLVSAVVSATQGPDRTAAINALKRYNEIHGDEELKNHLQDVSPAFRSYLLKELSEGSRPPSPKTSNVSMSERIKNLRSKLNVPEPSALQSSDEPPPSQLALKLRAKRNGTQAALSHVASANPPPTNPGQKPSDPDGSGAQRNEAMSFTVGDDNEAPPNPSVNAFRERLAAAKEKQDAAKSSSADVLSPMPATSATSRAAALRARLQAVKMQTEL